MSRARVGSVQAYNHALLIGKFYPPHKGHLHMIETAAELAKSVTVIVYATSYQHISLEDRMQWLQESVPANVRVEGIPNDFYEDYNDANVWVGHDHLLQAKLRVLGIRSSIDLIVSSEPYGQEMAERDFGGIDWCMVDNERKTVPISATKIRNDLFAQWEYLPIPVRRGLIPRVIVVGAESTGTTTLSKALSEHYGARYIPEYGREYTIDWLDALRSADPDATMEDLVWTRDDFLKIGDFQNVLEQRAAAQLEGFPLVIGDTDAWATAIWEQRYMETGVFGYLPVNFPPYATDAIDFGRDIYLLTDHVGVAFEDDGIRDGEGYIRETMTRVFEDELTRAGVPWGILRGTHEERMHMATTMINKVLRERTNFE